ncbi:MAG: hypothetical protein KGQ42_06310 [Alphaproteobacteria bacterium]|nr:hypothetical protein [Alphaproteobacteria bacterium]MDE2042531.1 hypothetical protein [Alphaproteobacteria bacterium]MDE2340931.1 hypothetical protein [Alphaproteobacteria bacterium]
MRKFLLSVALIAPFAAAPASVSAVGCLSGAAAGAVAGHYMGHHAIKGALAGCVAGHFAKKAIQHHKAAQARKALAAPAHQ